MTVRVMLVSPAMNMALRQPRFDDGASLDHVGLRQARAAAGALPEAGRYLRGPSTRCRETADALGLDAEQAGDLRDLDVGRWHGRTLDDVSTAEPRAVATWLSDPLATPHGGESLSALTARVGGWLDAGSDESGRILAVVEPAVVRAAAVHALGLPLHTFWRLDVPPLTLTTLTGRSGRWNLRCGQPLHPAAGSTD
ncbi:histidine phosphatase family protein [Streptomyces sp. NPDC051162]|uniref:histidine phosphatase family protein n=1 Tax=Streptomyces sp. NPDC051162 TaxID=3154747 RepID=UPI00341272DB